MKFSLSPRLAFLIIAAILLLYAAARRFGKNSPLLAGASLGKILGRVYLSPKASLHYVETGGRVLLVGVTPTAMSLVAGTRILPS